MKYKVGDRVRILSCEALEELAKKEAITIDPTIYDIAGKIQTIREVFDDDFYFMIDYPLLLSRRAFAETQEEREAVDASETIEQVKGDVERNYRKAIIEEQEKINEGLKENDKRKKRMKELYKGEQWSTEYECPDGYEFRDEKGNLIEAKKIVLEKKKTEWPTTFDECCDILDIDGKRLMFNNSGITEYERTLYLQLSKLSKLLICRDAYWKIAGDWKLSIGIPFYYLYYNRQLENIKKDYADDIQGNVILAFPTEEMRDAFYENFKELIEDCKELL